jgi:hypothetical protein
MTITIYEEEEQVCRRGEQTDAMGWLELGPNVR